MTAISSVIPLVGTTLVWLPAAGFLLLQGELARGLFLLAWGTLAVGTSDNFLRPIFIGGRGKVHFLIVLFGILGGLTVFGFVGVVLGPIILSLFPAIAAIYRELLPAWARDNPIPPIGSKEKAVRGGGGE
jgi:predicted PurR-regulated permease PerM